MTTIALADWQAEMGRRGKLDCRFVCPACGHTASPNDWRVAGADPQRAPQECIGRLRLVTETGMLVSAPPGGCDWAAFGFLDICTVHLQLPGKEKPVPVFAFAEPS